MPPTEDRIPSLFAIPMILVFVAIILFIGLVQRHGELSLMAGLVLFVFGGAYGWSKLSSARLKCRMTVDKRRMFPGEDFSVAVWVENAKPLPIWVRVQVSEYEQTDAFAPHAEFTGQCGLLWYQKTGFLWQATALRRGVHSLGLPYVTTADLFGFFPIHHREKPEEIIVYPRLIPLNPLEVPPKSMFGMPGTRSPVQDPVYILGTRDYQAGRPSRFIHWKASARHHRLQEKVFDPSEQEKVVLVLDVDGFVTHEAGKDFEQALEVIASLAVRLEQEGKAFGFATNADSIGGNGPFLPIAGHRQQLPNLLESLARLKMSVRTTGDDLLIGKMPTPSGASAVIFTYDAGQSSQTLARLLSIRSVPSIFVVCRPMGTRDALPVGIQAPAYDLSQIRIDRETRP